MGMNTFKSIFILFIFCAVDTYAMEQKLPDLVLEKVKNQPSEYVAVQIWSPFCGPCGEEVRELNEAIRNAGQKLAVLGVPVQARKREVNAFVEHFRPNYEQVDTKDSDFMKTSAVPWTILFSKKERIKEWHGKVTAVDLLAEMEQEKKRKGKL